MSKTGLKLTDAEWTVMDAVWTAAAPVRARDVHARVTPATGWAYTTVKTLLTRLVDKGALHESRDANAAVYRPALSRPRAQAGAVRALVGRAFGGRMGALLQHMTEQERLSARDRQRLRELLDALDRREAGR